MLQKSMVELFQEITKKELDILQKKSDDYSDKKDALSVFKNVANTIKVKPEIVALAFIGTKVERLSTLLNGQCMPKNEPLMDSIKDLRNYAFLLECLILDRNFEREGG